MTVSAGDAIPNVQVRVLGDDGMPAVVSSGELLGSGRVVLFAVPGAFTPGCSLTHLPGFVEGASELVGKGIDKIVCISMNDAWVMDAWGASSGAADAGIVMASDGNGDFTRAMGLEMDGAGYGLGSRSRRYAAIIDNGTITSLEVEPGGSVDVSSCSSVLARL